MPNDVVERVALAILNSDREMAGLGPVCSRLNVPESDGYVVNAIAALKALRDPTPEMVDAGNRTAGREAQWHCSVDEIWSAMLSAAIGEG